MIHNTCLESGDTLNRRRHVEGWILQGEFLNGTMNGRWDFLEEGVGNELGKALEGGLRRSNKEKYFRKMMKKMYRGVQDLV